MSNLVFFNDTAPTEIYTLSLHDALPIYRQPARRQPGRHPRHAARRAGAARALHVLRRLERVQRDVLRDRKSTRLNSSHANISYAVFCLKKKKKSFSVKTRK